jgi:trigger factor
MVDGEDWKEGEDVVVEMTYERLPEIPELRRLEGARPLVVKADDKPPSTRRWKTWPVRQDFDDRKKGAKAKDGDQV